MSASKRIVAVYDYHDRDGELLYQVVRFDPKDFRPRKPDGYGGWKYSLAGVARVLYHLPQILAGPLERVIWFVEGEKDADTLGKLGILATTLAGGSNTRLTAGILAPLRGRSVVLVPDHDEPGREYMQRVAGMLQGIARSIGWLELPGVPEKGDASDWFELPGSDVFSFLKLPVRDVTRTMTDRTGDDTREPGASPRQPRIDPKRDIVKLEDLVPTHITWLWKPWLPLGKLCLIDGDPGQGKSYMTLDLAARLSRGEPFPDGSPGFGKPVPTMLISCEDGLRDTVLPRLEALGADTRYICCYQGERRDGHPIRLPSLPDDMDNLEALIVESGAKLVVIDPLMAFLAGSINSISDQSIRQVLTPLASLAEKLDVTILFVRHLNKSNGKQAIYRGGGSIGIIAAMRTAMLIARHPHDRDLRVLAMVKCNLGKEPQSLGFRLTASERVPDGTAVVWTGPLDLQANDLVGDVKEVMNPKEWLKMALISGPRLTTELLEEATIEGFSDNTIRRAKVALGIVAKKKGGRGPWYWLPPGQTHLPSEDGSYLDELPPLEDIMDLDEKEPDEEEEADQKAVRTKVERRQRKDKDPSFL